MFWIILAILFMLAVLSQGDMQGWGLIFIAYCCSAFFGVGIMSLWNWYAVGAGLTVLTFWPSFFLGYITFNVVGRFA